MKNGWIKSYRRILDHPLLDSDNSAFIVFIKLLHKVDKETGEWTTGRYRLSELTNLKPTTAYQALKRLQKAKMVTLASDNKKTLIHISNWRKYQQPNDSTADNKMTSNRHQTDTNTRIRIENKINTTNVVFGKPEINDIFTYWAEATEMPISVRVKANRMAANNLIRKHGEEGVRRLIRGVVLAQGDKYAPRIADFSDLQAKYPQLILWGKKQTNNVEVIS